MREHQRPPGPRCDRRGVFGSPLPLVTVTLVAMLFLVAGWTGLWTAAAGATSPGRSPLPGTVPAVPPESEVGSPLSAEQTVRVDVGLTVADPQGLASFVQQSSTPGGPGYREHLAPGQFASRFGPAPSSVAAVRSWLAGAGLTLGATSDDGLLVAASGPAPTVAAAFGTELRSVRLASGAEAYTDTIAPSVPSQVAGSVTGVVGLSNVTPWRSSLQRGAPSGTTGGAPATPSPGSRSLTPSAAAPEACAAGAGPGFPGGPVTFTEAAQAYGADALYAEGRSGVGIKVALYELEPFRPSDIAAFQECYGVHNPVRTITVDGGAGSGGGSGEAALDIEEVSALAPGATLLVYEGPNNTGTGPIDTLDRIATDDAAQVVSTSWGQCEPENTPTRGGNAPVEAEIFAEMAAQGQTVVAASGDRGSEDCWDATPSAIDTDTQLAVDDPSSQPDVTGVGGTVLPSLTPSAQTVWNDCQSAGTSCAKNPDAGATGGGVSAVWSMPAWQQGAGRGTVGPDSTGAPCSAPAGSYCRQVPDVAANADPGTGYPIFFDGGWLVVGGTSAGSPLWGALVALADQGCAATVGFANPVLYALGGSGSSAFTDVTSGNNDLTNTNGGLYPAGAGYDMSTGWGSPDGGPLVSGLQPAGGCPSVASLSSTGGPLSGGTVVTVNGAGLAGASAVDFTGTPATILSDTATAVTVLAPPAGFSAVVFVTVTTRNGTSAESDTARYTYGTPRTGLGYWEAAADGGVFAYGNAEFHGSMGGQHLNAPIVGLAATATDGGYWEVASDGGIFAFGKAGFHGSMGGQHLNAPIVGLSATATGGGYWEVAADGGVFAFGNAAFYGSMGGQHLNAPIVGLAATATGGGYWEVAADGGIFAFGNAQFSGSMGGTPLNRPVVGIAPTPHGRGYWEVASDGGIFAFGGSGFFGSMGGQPLNRPVVGIAAIPTGKGYWEVASDGGIFAFGGAGFYGSGGSLSLVAPVVAMAST
jgi:hypothetical protein